MYSALLIKKMNEFKSFHYLH